MNRIIVRTNAYNAEKTIKRAINSVLAQNFVGYVPTYILANNGSTDHTGEIIDNYAKKNDWIVPFHNKVNRRGQFAEKLIEIIEDYPGDGYFFNLDADDEYSPFFIEKMITFMEENRLDVAACGSDFIDATNSGLLGIRRLEHNLILETPEEFSEHFGLYHQFMRTVWGKVYKLSVLRKCKFEQVKTVSYGKDTVCTMETFCNAERVGILAESLHKYYFSLKSVSHLLDSKRIVSDQILYEETKNFLVSKCGYVSLQNEEFLLRVYLSSIIDTLNLVLNAQLPHLEKMQLVLDIFTCKITREMFNSGYIENTVLNKIRGIVLEWLLTQEVYQQTEETNLAVELIIILYEEHLRFIKNEYLWYYIQNIPNIIRNIAEKDYTLTLEKLQTYYKMHEKDVLALSELEIILNRMLNKPEEVVFALFIDIKNNRPRSSKALNIDLQIKMLIAKYPLLENMNVELACAFSDVVGWIIRGNYTQALEVFINTKNVEICDEDVEVYIMFGQNFSAVVENADLYIYFKKMWISYLIDYSRKEEASREIKDFEQILSEDKEFLELRKRLSSIL
ncbi:glycosyltransferase family 2 protein [Ruminiclostridium cellobioparum]|uniref:Glycosyltransferases involved in cell wall biogenesis n=1 Tax=Ruminiclostridium cellobioparum subsp. termitidis CT1112 TaxID=1195236 RepID=S0FGB2_RUMCE|nr:glycosyltransferase family 2 protein [Ruminiclostridium cellobioparum]EMS70380.1 Glycosyltransferases involved in cell wall biogenesis [Ruminiclostridium cellobioparum subsp. termitidis CT1112]